jgi:hypothetical protein
MVPSGRLPRSTSRIIGLSISPQTLLLGEISSSDQLLSLIFSPYLVRTEILALHYEWVKGGFQVGHRSPRM